ncbi:TetR/AcrR family transcriptional regulator [Micromonospora carbonacea]|uniref:TetR/AcrR family transcriptional regulator n=1 Tax=Micromonospora carbonacea TaxID=47853 RepID=UPI003D73C1BC
MRKVDTGSGRDAVRAKIVEAAAQLLSEGGARAVTTRAVAERAGVQAPTIYRLFGDKDGLVEAVAESVMRDYASAKAADLDDDLDPVGALRAAWQRHIDFGLSNPELYVMLSVHPNADPSPATVDGIRVLRRHVARMASAGLLVVSERRAVDMIHATGSGTVLALLAQSSDVRDHGLADAVFGAVLAAISDLRPAGGDPRQDTLAALVRIGAVVGDLTPLTAQERGLLTEWIERCIRAFEASTAT